MVHLLSRSVAVLFPPVYLFSSVQVRPEFLFFPFFFPCVVMFGAQWKKQPGEAASVPSLSGLFFFPGHGETYREDLALPLFFFFFFSFVLPPFPLGQKINGQLKLPTLPAPPPSSLPLLFFLKMVPFSSSFTFPLSREADVGVRGPASLPPPLSLPCTSRRQPVFLSSLPFPLS